MERVTELRSASQGVHLHFWTAQRPKGIDAWVPDLEPEAFPSGYGHSFLEPFARLGKVVSTSIGRWPPRRTTCIIASLEELTEWRSHVLPDIGLQLALAASVCRSVAVVRNDIPLGVEVPTFTSLELMPNPESVRDPARQVAVPPFPQRGLIPRDPGRGTSIRVVALKALSFNVPEWVVEPQFADTLQRSGIELRIDTEEDDSPSWHDFKEVDIALCVRRERPRFSSDKEDAHARKPPTKLINAWHAGAIPIVAPEAAYLGLIKDGVDGLIAATPEEVLTAIQRLSSDPVLVERMQIAGRGRAAEHSVSEATQRWAAALRSVPKAPVSTIAASVGSMTAGCIHGGVRVLKRAARR